ncbi:MAG: hypothetical protein M1495_22735 [Bacteroidetes bacterium]|nr:hypothetical protein [Bacteroidota bacterium]
MNSPLESFDAILEYVNRYADQEVIAACDLFYEIFIEWEIRRSKSIEFAEELGNKLVKNYLLKEELV